MKTNRFLLLIPLGLLVVVGGFLLSVAGPTGSEAAADNAVVNENATPYVPDNRFNEYWYAGKAELNSYELQQARYGEVHSGEAVLIFVTENFSLRELTKGDGLGGTQIPILKVNFDKKFITGIYPYSMIMTVATPVDMNRYPRALKVATSSQEWCGHTYTQLNLRGNKYEFAEHSYFPGEGDQEMDLPAITTEDELWTRIRIAPDQLPTGEIELLPATFYARLKHRAVQPKKAVAKLGEASDGTGNSVYTIDYADGSRSLKIYFEPEFPYTIEGWEETYSSGWGAGAQKLTTRASRKKTMKLDYWNRNSNSDRALRKELGLEGY
ncbi:MAG: hypothetical protein AAGN35_24045 [Bacteroidota bacterium]